MEDMTIGNVINSMVVERYNSLLDRTVYMIESFYSLKSKIEINDLLKTKMSPDTNYDMPDIIKNMEMLEKVGNDYTQRVTEIKESLELDNV